MLTGDDLPEPRFVVPLPLTRATFDEVATVWVGL
jgi:hypothetical protein